MPVALIESEKTAIICSGLMHQYLWLAAGGKSSINDRLVVFQGERLSPSPTSTASGTGLPSWPSTRSWASPSAPSCSRRNAEDLEAHIDIADRLIRHKLHPPKESVKKHCVDFLKIARYISLEYHDELDALIEDLDLEFWGVERIEAEEDPPAESTDL